MVVVDDSTDTTVGLVSCVRTTGVGARITPESINCCSKLVDVGITPDAAVKEVGILETDILGSIINEGKFTKLSSSGKHDGSNFVVSQVSGVAVGLAS